MAKLQINWLTIELTKHCNLNCTYCYAKACITPKTKLIAEDDQVFKTIDGFANQYNGKVLALSGGEPLLKDNLFAIADFAKKRKLQLILLTNGLLINESNVLLVKKFFDFINISCDSEQSFNALKKTFDLLKKNIVPFMIHVTITKKNKYLIKKFCDLGKVYGAEYVDFNVVTKNQRIPENSNILLSNKEAAEVYETLSGLKVKHHLFGVWELKDRDCCQRKREFSWFINTNGQVLPVIDTNYAVADSLCDLASRKAQEKIMVAKKNINLSFLEACKLLKKDVVVDYMAILKSKFAQKDNLLICKGDDMNMEKMQKMIKLTNKVVPQLVGDVIFQKNPVANNYYVYKAKIGKLLSINSSMYSLLMKVDGDKNLKDLATLIKREYDCEDEGILDQVKKSIRTMAMEGIIYV